ncbi:hypothetical protein LZ575_03775 [Antarcticibacterium sp. 1MA-6-2]|uniref:hypothetical protein n=1 Tax=Antarcticibacterium sp. 1MA-6-2 TaxID=2908210 RepID=UPI001F416243|nr:hypothetical protein [Antarcticibacterium sp. 1MA-6-2]UJH91797.1 hypothetical protein LZ575_03775 [Antarcticibacterium sp. 1MA-6-2]
MRFKNTTETKIVPSVYILIVAAFVTNIFVNIEIMASDDENNMTFSHFLPNILLLLFGIYFHRIGQLFEFDSDGETLNFKNNGVFFSKFMEYRVKRAEFPKSKLINFEVSDYGIWSSLKIFIRSRRKKGPRTYRFNITFLGKKKKRGMIESLRKVLEKNKALT